MLDHLVHHDRIRIGKIPIHLLEPAFATLDAGRVKPLDRIVREVDADQTPRWRPQALHDPEQGSAATADINDERVGRCEGDHRSYLFRLNIVADTVDERA